MKINKLFFSDKREDFRKNLDRQIQNIHPHQISGYTYEQTLRMLLYFLNSFVMFRLRFTKQNDSVHLCNKQIRTKKQKNVNENKNY